MKKLFGRKRGTMLPENVIFIILNVLFLTVLIVFITKQGSGIINLEESYAKQISLLIDSATANSEINLNMDKAHKISEKNGIDFKNVVKIDNENNLVEIKLSADSGYIYSFFNDVEVVAYPDGNVEKEENYIFILS